MASKEDLKEISQKLLDCEAMMAQLPPSAFKALVVRAQHTLLSNAKLIKRLVSESHLAPADRALLIQELNVGLTHVVRIYQEAGAVPATASAAAAVSKGVKI